MLLSKLEEMPKKTVTALSKKHIYTVNDLLRWFPRKYRDYREVKDIMDCPDGEYCAVAGKLMKVQVKQGSKGKFLRLSFLSEGKKDRLGNEVWFRVDMFVSRYANYLERVYTQEYYRRDCVVTGKVSKHPVYGISISDSSITLPVLFKNEIAAVYPKTGSVKDEDFRSWLEQCLQLTGEVLEDEIRAKAGLYPYREALRMIHHPESPEEIERAKEQFVFYDLFWFYSRLVEMNAHMPEKSEILMPDTSLMEKFIASLPFPLTRLTSSGSICQQENMISGGQEEAVRSMAARMATGGRLNALVEGDVGCGKTLVAASMLMLAAGNGFQACLLAPKTVLARQHYEEIGGYCEKMGLKCAFLAGTPNGAEERKERKEILKKLREGEIQVIVGTHGCFSREVVYKNLGLIIYDEEQIFGVDQKIAMFEKGLPGVHTIEMSATPIPRSLAMSVYSNKSICRITEKPAGRVPVQTAAWSYDRPGAVTTFMEKQLAMGRQCYVVAPAIEDNEDAGLVGVNTVAERYHDHFAPLGYKVVIANGRMKDEEFTKAIDSFKSGEAQILVATTVIEVGVNVPNATVIVIEQAERFGLSQLHQLRGRVGRKDYKSYCVLFTMDRGNERIIAMERTTDGFEIAEEDYRLRGPGDVNGTDQSGQNLYIDEILAYPKVYEKAKKAVELCNDKNRYGMILRLMYREHEMTES